MTRGTPEARKRCRAGLAKPPERYRQSLKRCSGLKERVSRAKAK